MPDHFFFQVYIINSEGPKLDINFEFELLIHLFGIQVMQHEKATY